jgi:hypothetical protein
MFEFGNFYTLKEAGLLVSPISVGPYKGGYAIAKPQKVQGNSRKGYEIYFGQEEILTDAPCSRLYVRSEKLIFCVKESVPGPGPGDFEEKFDDVESCFKSVLDYYFGYPSRMNPPELLE